MTEQPRNPLVAARATTAVGRLERGTDLALAQLQAYCDEVNAKEWVRASGDPFVVIGKAPDRRIGRASERRRA